MASSGVCFNQEVCRYFWLYFLYFELSRSIHPDHSVWSRLCQQWRLLTTPASPLAASDSRTVICRVPLYSTDRLCAPNRSPWLSWGSRYGPHSDTHFGTRAWERTIWKLFQTSNIADGWLLSYTSQWNGLHGVTNTAHGEITQWYNTHKW